jgi:Protein of unknown function (DUF3795)
MREHKESPRKDSAAVCGLNCGECSAYIATQKAPDIRKQLAEKDGINEESLRCNGCRSQKRCLCSEQCKMFDCAWERGYEFCHECSDYPCAELKLFRIERQSKNEPLFNRKKYFTL